MKRLVMLAAALALVWTPSGAQTLTKLKAGKQVFSNTITEPDLEAAKKACEGQDFLWIEMQHSTLTWRETQQLIA